MHFTSTNLAFALALANTALSLPSRGATNDVVLPTLTNPTGAQPTYPSGNTLPAECDGFKPYVPEIVLEAVCSLHMTPGAVPTLNSACFGGGAGAQPTIPVPIPQETFSAAATSWGGDEGAATTHGGGGQASVTRHHGGDQQPTATIQSQGGQSEPTGAYTGAAGTQTGASQPTGY